MKTYTSLLKKELIKLDSCEERIDFLKDKYQGKTAVIILPGPSLNDYNHNKLREIFSTREDLVIMPNKGAYDISLETSDFHLMNPWNIDRKNPIKYIKEENTIPFWNVTAAYQEEHTLMISDNNHPCDIWVPVLTEPWIKKEECIHCKKEKIKLNYYYCEICEGYHLTRMTNKQQTSFIKMSKTAWYKRKKAGEKNEVP